MYNKSLLLTLHLFFILFSYTCFVISSSYERFIVLFFLATLSFYHLLVTSLPHSLIPALLSRFPIPTLMSCLFVAALSSLPIPALTSPSLSTLLSLPVPALLSPSIPVLLSPILSYLLSYFMLGPALTHFTSSPLKIFKRVLLNKPLHQH